MKPKPPILFIICALANVLNAATPGDAPQLPITGTRIIAVSTEPQLQSAIGNLQNGDTILLANGTYNLSSTLYIKGHQNITVRGTNGSTNVVLVGKGMDNSSYGNVPLGIWSNSTNTTVAHLTIRDTWDNEIIFNSGAQSPHVYCVRLLNSGSQFIKSNPTDTNAGIGVDNGVVEYCWFEYTSSPPGDHGSGAGYFNGISAHAAKNWIVRGNMFKNLHNPDTAAYLWNPAVLFWRHSINTITEQNIFLNVDRAVAYGLDNTTPYFDHAGGIVRNNFVYLTPGLMSAGRKSGSDGSIIAWNSPGTQIDHNSVLLNGNEFYPIEFRFSTTTNCTGRNNLADAAIHLRDSAAASLSGNLSTANAAMFVNAAAADLHLVAAASIAIDKVPTLGTVTNDFDGDLRPLGTNSEIGADELAILTSPSITSVRLAGTNVILGFTTVTSQSYNVLRADIISGPWDLIASNIPGTGGVIQFTNVSASSQSRQFYRISSSR